MRYEAVDESDDVLDDGSTSVLGESSEEATDSSEDVAGAGDTVVAVLAAGLASGMTPDAAALLANAADTFSPEDAERINREIAVGYMAEPIDQAYGILFLASDESRYMTGTELVIDGGFTAH